MSGMFSEAFGGVGSGLTDRVAAHSSSYSLASSSTSIASFGNTTKRSFEFSNGCFA